jgi:hypothetical protein
MLGLTSRVIATIIMLLILFLMLETVCQVPMDLSFGSNPHKYNSGGGAVNEPPQPPISRLLAADETVREKE